MSADSPLWVKWLHARRKDGETGAGDTAKRLFSVMGGEQYKLLRKNLSFPCRCTQRQKEWNEKYPYEIQVQS